MAGRQRKAREPKYDTANGTVGRLTGLPMPKNVPITDEGYEDFEAFFTDAGPSTRRRSSSSKASQPAADLLSKAARREARSKHNPSSVAPNFELGTVGRRTGIQMRTDVPRTQDGYEDFEAFFKSPGSTASASSSAAKGKSRSRRVSSVGVGRRTSVADLSTRSPAKQFDQDDHDEDMSEPEQDQEEDTAPAPVDFEFEAGADNGPQQDSDEPLSPTQDQQDPFDAESDADEGEEERDTVAPLPNDLAPDSDTDGLPAMDQPDESHLAGSSPSPHSRSSASASAKKAGKRRASSSDENQPPPKQSKAKKPAAKRQRKWESEEPEGVRRSSRQHIKPLEYWRNERLVYGRRQSGVQPAYGIKEIVRVPPAEHRSLVHKRAKGRRGGGGSQRSGSEQPSHAGAAAADETEYEGWDDATDPDGLVWDYNSQEETHRRVAFTSKMISTKQAGKHNYRFQKVFTDGDFMACGLLEIPPNEKKPLKPSKDNTFMLFVFRGAVRVLVYRTTFTVATGGFFLVPRGNSYEIENIGMDDATVVFMQAREVRLVDEPNASFNAAD